MIAKVDQAIEDQIEMDDLGARVQIGSAYFRYPSLNAPQGPSFLMRTVEGGRERYRRVEGRFVEGRFIGGKPQITVKDPNIRWKITTSDKSLPELVKDGTRKMERFYEKVQGKQDRLFKDTERDGKLLFDKTAPDYPFAPRRWRLWDLGGELYLETSETDDPTNFEIDPLPAEVRRWIGKSRRELPELIAWIEKQASPGF